MEVFPSVFLAGQALEENLEGYRAIFGNFWSFRTPAEPSRGISSNLYLEKTPAERQTCAPIAVHGDEGRGLSKVPLLAISFQPAIPSSGPNNLSQIAAS